MEKVKKPFYKKWWVWAIAVLAIIVISNGGNSKKDVTADTKINPPASSTAAAAKPAEPAKPKYELLEHKAVKEGYGRYIVGKVKNNSGREVGYAQIEINLYDKDGAQVGTTMANVTNLEKDGTWSFKAMILEDKTESYKIKDITGF